MDNSSIVLIANLNFTLMTIGAITWGLLLLDSLRRRCQKLVLYHNKPSSLLDAALAVIAVSATAALCAPVWQIKLGASFNLFMGGGLTELAVILGGVGLFTTLVLCRRPLAILLYPVAASAFHFAINHDFHGIHVTLFASCLVALPASLFSILNIKKGVTK